MMPPIVWGRSMGPNAVNFGPGSVKDL
jgi:hypothetical protein